MILLSAALLLSGCGGEPSSEGGIDGGGAPAATGSATRQPIARPSPTAGTTGRADVDIGRVNAVCQQALDYYRQNKDRDDPVRSQIASNQAISGAASELEALGYGPLTALVGALNDYAANGAQRAAAMDRGDFDSEDRLYKESQGIGARIEAAATELGATTCAQLAGI
ncbi:hypothetical protein [Virgisporangium ochraceum]|nr:hypothetical protein [Virgisporangium ochraceum]